MILCCCGGGISGFSGCGCSTLPASVTFTVTNGYLAGNQYISDVLTFGATPSDYFPGFGGGAQGWWGATRYTYGPYTCQERLFCSAGNYNVGYYYWPSSYATPAAAAAASSLYLATGVSWINGLSGNHCSPFGFSNEDYTFPGCPSGPPFSCALS